MTSFVALGLAVLAVVGLVVHVWLLNFAFVIFETYFGKPKLTLLKSSHAGNGMAFGFDFNDSKEPAKFNRFRIRLFNPFGKPTQVEVSSDFAPQGKSFAMDLDMGEGLSHLLGAENFDKGRIMLEVSSDADGIVHQYEMPATKFKTKLSQANKTADEFSKVELDTTPGQPPIDIPLRSFIADVVPGKGNQLAIATNPAYAHLFGGGGGEADAGAATAEQFAVSKVWIEPGCIVCNACEDIYPEVFEVTADTCLIRPNPPLDDGLKIQDAAEACPVEVIKFTKVG